MPDDSDDYRGAVLRHGGRLCVFGRWRQGHAGFYFDDGAGHYGVYRGYRNVCNLHSAVLALSIPAAVAVGSVIGAALIGMAVGLSLYDAVLVGSGFGWYSFSSVVISAMYSTEIGTVSFLANMLRELSAFFLIPLLVRVHKLLALAPSGAATMDSGLPVVIKYTNLHVGMYSFINGLVLTLIVPVLLSWLLSLK